jgi:hypothetical protein
VYQEKAARAKMVSLLHGLLLKENAAPAALDAIVTLQTMFTNALQEPGNNAAQASRMAIGPSNRSLRVSDPVVRKLLSTTGGEALLCTGGFRPKTVDFEKYFVFDPEEAGRTARVTLGVQGGVMPTASDVYSASPSMKAKWRSVGLGVLRTCIAQLAKVVHPSLLLCSQGGCWEAHRFVLPVSTHRSGLVIWRLRTAQVEKSAYTNAEKAVHATELKQEAKHKEREQLLAAIEADKQARKKRFTYA